MLVSSHSKKLQCLATVTGGRMYNLSNVKDLPKVLSTSINTPVNDNQTPVNTQEDQQQNYEYYND